MSTDPNEKLEQNDPTASPSEPTAPVDEAPPESATSSELEPESSEPPSEGESPKKKILIGSQRDPDSYRPITRNAKIPVVNDIVPSDVKPSTEKPAQAPKIAPKPIDKPAAPIPESKKSDGSERPPRKERGGRGGKREKPERVYAAPPLDAHYPVPNLRRELSDELQDEFDAILNGVEMEGLVAKADDATKQEPLEQEDKVIARILSVRRDEVFVELVGRIEQGFISAKQFDKKVANDNAESEAETTLVREVPEAGTEIEVVVVRAIPEEGLYELSLPNAAASVADWSDLNEGMVVEANITGHNTGGLEAEVNKIRGFIPISQIELYRVENIEEFVGKRFKCIVTEANPERRNLVLSRRDLLEREQAEAREKLLEKINEGDGDEIFEGVVRKLMDFGAFVDLGDGVDGLLHISELSWGRVQHPSDVLVEGQRISVRIKKYDPETQRIGLAYREMLANPWDEASAKYAEGGSVRARIVKIMDFGAFAELEPGVEGLIHISELGHARVHRVSDVVKEGEEVEVKILSVDMDQHRIGLSLKQMTAPPKREGEEAKPSDEPVVDESLQKLKKPKSSHEGPLKGGTGKDSGGEQFGLKW
jgi:ribosomal protein S1